MDKDPTKRIVLDPWDAKAHRHLVAVDAKAFDDSWRKDHTFYVGRGGSGAAIGNRYAAFKDYLATGKPIYASTVHVRPDGRVGFTNGRHRFAVMRDGGITRIPVAMLTSDIRRARKFGLLAAGDQMTESAEQKVTARRVGDVASEIFQTSGAYGVLDREVSGAETFTCGGCLVAADAVKKAMDDHGVRGELVGLFGARRSGDEALQHVAVRSGGLIVDADGAKSEKSFVDFWGRVEGITNPSLRPLTKPEGIPRNSEASSKLAAMITRALDEVVSEARNMGAWNELGSIEKKRHRAEKMVEMRLAADELKRSGLSKSSITKFFKKVGAEVEDYHDGEFGVMPGGYGDANNCSQTSAWMQSLVGGTMYAWDEGKNAEAKLGEITGWDDHEFLILDDRFLVDFWLWCGWRKQGGVFDLRDPSDAKKVEDLYGPRSNWKKETGHRVLYGPDGNDGITHGVNETVVNEDVKFVRKVSGGSAKPSNPLKNLGRSGWFHVYVDGPSRKTKVTKADSAKTEELAVEAAKIATAKLGKLGFRRLGCVVVFSAYDKDRKNYITGGETGGSANTQDHGIWINSVRLTVDHAAEMLVHEWLHFYHREMPKDSKEAWDKFYLSNVYHRVYDVVKSDDHEDSDGVSAVVDKYLKTVADKKDGPWRVESKDDPFDKKRYENDVANKLSHAADEISTNFPGGISPIAHHHLSSIDDAHDREVAAYVAAGLFYNGGVLRKLKTSREIKHPDTGEVLPVGSDIGVRMVHNDRIILTDEYHRGSVINAKDYLATGDISEIAKYIDLSSLKRYYASWDHDVREKVEAYAERFIDLTKNGRDKFGSPFFLLYEHAKERLNSVVDSACWWLLYHIVEVHFEDVKSKMGISDSMYSIDADAVVEEWHQVMLKASQSSTNGGGRGTVGYLFPIIAEKIKVQGFKDALVKAAAQEKRNKLLNATYNLSKPEGAEARKFAKRKGLVSNSYGAANAGELWTTVGTDLAMARSVPDHLRRAFLSVIAGQNPNPAGIKESAGDFTLDDMNRWIEHEYPGSGIRMHQAGEKDHFYLRGDELFNQRTDLEFTHDADGKPVEKFDQVGELAWKSGVADVMRKASVQGRDQPKVKPVFFEDLPEKARRQISQRYNDELRALGKLKYPIDGTFDGEDAVVLGQVAKDSPSVKLTQGGRRFTTLASHVFVDGKPLVSSCPERKPIPFRPSQGMVVEDRMQDELIKFIKTGSDDALAALHQIDPDGRYDAKPKPRRREDVSRRELDDEIPSWAEDRGIDVSYLGDEPSYEDLNPEHRKKFDDWIEDNLSSEYEQKLDDWKKAHKGFTDPSDVYIGPYESLSGSEWLVHFTKQDVEYVAEHGFKYGVGAQFLVNSGVGHSAKGEMSSGRFAFAFLADSRDAEENFEKGNYGDDLVVFKARSAIRAYHGGDNEYQVIFDRKYTFDRVAVREESKGRYVVEDHGGDEVFDGSYEQLLSWLKSEYPKVRSSVGYGSEGSMTESTLFVDGDSVVAEVDDEFVVVTGSAISSLFEAVLLEMPWIDVGHDKVFDLEIERFSIQGDPNHDPTILLRRIKHILAGEEVVDSLGNSIVLRTSKEKSAFIRKLRRDDVFSSWVGRFFGDSQPSLVEPR